VLGLPESTELKKQLPKTAIYQKFNMDTAAKDRFDADIRRIDIVGEVSPSAAAIAPGEIVSSFFVLLVTLRKMVYNEKNILLITKLIPQNLLLVLEYEGKSRLAVFRTKLIQSDWRPTDEQMIQLRGIDLDAVWENIITEVGGIEIKDGRTLDGQIAADDERQKLQKEIEKLEKLARAEKQPKKKFELVQEINRIRKDLE
jgi:hypothetical protein